MHAVIASMRTAAAWATVIEFFVWYCRLYCTGEQVLHCASICLAVLGEASHQHVDCDAQVDLQLLCR